LPQCEATIGVPVEAGAARVTHDGRVIWDLKRGVTPGTNTRLGEDRYVYLPVSGGAHSIEVA